MNAKVQQPTAPLDATAHAIALLTETIADCNMRFCAMLGRARSDVIGRTMLELSTEVQADGAYSRERWPRRSEAARAGHPQWFPWQFRNAAGRALHTLVHLESGAGAAGALVVHVHDLSHLHDARLAAPETRLRLQNVLDHTKSVIFIKDLEGRYVFANRELERAVRMRAEDIIGRTDREIWPPDLAERFRANDAQVLASRSAAEFEVVGTLGGTRRTFGSFKLPLFGADGEPYAVCGIAADITERKRTQDALTAAALAVSSAQGATVFQELVRYLATILEADIAMITSPGEEQGAGCMQVHAYFVDGEVRENFTYPLAGTPCELVMGQSFRIFPSALRERFSADLDLHKMGMESYAGYPLTGGDGAPLGLIAVISRRPMVNAEFVESILKIFAVRAAAEMERQRAEESLRASEASYRAIFDSSVDAVFIHDWDTGAVIDVNRSACDIYGYTYDELRRVDLADLCSGVHPYTAGEAAKLVERAKASGPVRFEWHRRNKDGSLHWDEVVLRPAVIAGHRRVVAFTREVTERKQAEQALRQAQKMEALGHLTGGIAHDFNNLLTSIMGYVVLAADQAPAGEPRLTRYLEQAQLSCARARDLIQQMLAFSRGQRGDPRPVSLPQLIGQSIKLFGASFPSTIAFETDLGREVPAVMVDPVHLDQVFLNLCLNARDAMNGTGTIRVSVSGVREAGASCAACRQAVAGEFVALGIADDGPGIAPEVMERMFDPFYTTKEVGKGSGMGLASVHGIVHELGGHILVETAPGKGARFRVLLPTLSAGHEVAAAGEAERARARAARLAGRVLVVDDERAVAGFMQDLLESWGLTVGTAGNAEEALARFRENPDAIDLVITDQAMPRRTGIELTRDLLAAKPALPVILYTGFNQGIPRAELEAAGLRGVLVKPVDPHELYGLLRTSLPRSR